jgi:filamentous hemagglutinin
LLAAGYRLVDAGASKAPGANPVATEFIAANSGSLFSATDAERRNSALYGNSNGTPTPEQQALNTSHTPNIQPLSWAVSGGVYYGVGGEFEISFTGISPTEAKLGLGVGIGAHGWLSGAGHGANTDLVSYGSSAKAGDYRIGSSLSGSVFFGPASGQIGASAGVYSNVQNKPTTGGYWQAKGGIAVAPVIGIGVEVKANVIEFNYKRK